MAREKTLRVVLSFETTTMAMKMERQARLAGAPGRLIPLPRQISAGCGMAWSAPAAARPALERLIQENEIVVEHIAELLL